MYLFYSLYPDNDANDICINILTSFSVDAIASACGHKIDQLNMQSNMSVLAIFWRSDLSKMRSYYIYYSDEDSVCSV